MYVTNSNYLKNRPFYFIKFSKGNTKESNKIKKLNKAAVILDNNNKYLLDLSNLKAKKAKKWRKNTKKY